MGAPLSLLPFCDVPYVGRHYCRVFAAEVLAAHGLPYPTSKVQRLDWQRVERPQLFDVVVFNRSGRPAHVGVMVGPTRFLHVERDARSRIERLGPQWQIEGFYRYTGRTE
jgi:hypothetical protein